MMRDEEGKDSDLEGDKKIIRQKIPEIQDVFRYMSLQWSNAFKLFSNKIDFNGKMFQF